MNPGAPPFVPEVRELPLFPGSRVPFKQGACLPMNASRFMDINCKKMRNKMMNNKPLKLAAAAFALAIPLTFTGCATSGTAEQPAGPGAIAVDTATVTAKVAAIDRRDRRVTLVGPKGHRMTYTVSKAAVNFDQVRVGDRVKATVTEAVAVFLRPKGTQPGAGEGMAVALAPKGAMPGGVVVNTTEVTAQVTAVDPAEHRVTLKLPNGKKRTLSVNPSIDLTKVSPGDAVTAQVTDALALQVEKP
jgi:translation initiation factor IF-1